MQGYLFLVNVLVVLIHADGVIEIFYDVSYLLCIFILSNQTNMTYSLCSVQLRYWHCSSCKCLTILHFILASWKLWESDSSVLQ